MASHCAGFYLRRVALSMQISARCPVAVAPGPRCGRQEREGGKEEEDLRTRRLPRTLRPWSPPLPVPVTSPDTRFREAYLVKVTDKLGDSWVQNTGFSTSGLGLFCHPQRLLTCCFLGSLHRAGEWVEPRLICLDLLSSFNSWFLPLVLLDPC